MSEEVQVVDYALGYEKTLFKKQKYKKNKGWGWGQGESFGCC